MIGEAYIKVWCNRCKREEDVELTRTARGWDDRDVKSTLESWGWLYIDDDTQYCEECSPDDET